MYTKENLHSVPDMSNIVNNSGISLADIVSKEENIIAALQRLQENKAAECGYR